MLVYREQQHRAPAARLLRAARDRLAGLAPAHAGAHDRTVALLIELGVLESAVADALQPEADDLHPVTGALRAASLAAGHLLWHSWRNEAYATPRWVARASAALDAAERGGLPEAVTWSVPEGFAYYGLYPETYLEAAARAAQACPAPRVVCLGLRSIGTSLSAAAGAAFEQLGRDVLSVTVRPRGHPFDRRPRLSPALENCLRARADDLFVLVDEGPGLSGSSLAGTARALVLLGIPEDRVVLLPSWPTDGRTLRSAEARARWPRHPQFTASFEEVWVASGRLDAVAPGRTLDNLSAGAWRPLLLDSVHAYPPVQAHHERRKYLARTAAEPAKRSGAVSLRFAGLGVYGERRAARAQALADAGLAPAPARLAHGFLVQPFRDGQPARAAVSDELMEAMAAYLAAIRRLFPAGDCATDLRPMVETNVGQALGPDATASALERLDATGDVVPTALDARMFPHEWIRTAGGWEKTDALDHCDDHFYPGPQDIAWDLAGTCVEFGLSRDARRALLERYVAASGDRHVRRRLPAMTVAYLAFRLGYDTLAAEQLAGTADGARFQTRARGYRRRLAAELSSGVRATWEP